jgi:hypothetical protein
MLPDGVSAHSKLYALALDPAFRTLLDEAETREAERHRRAAAGRVLAVARVNPDAVLDRIEMLTTAFQAFEEDAATTAKESDERRGVLIAETRRDLARAIAAVAGFEVSPHVAEAVAATLAAEDSGIVRVGLTAAERFVNATTEHEDGVGLGVVAAELAALLEQVANPALTLAETTTIRASSVLSVAVHAEPTLSEPLVTPLTRATVDSTSSVLEIAPLSVLESIATVRPAAVAAYPETVDRLLDALSDSGVENGSPAFRVVAAVLTVLTAAPTAATGHFDIILTAVMEYDGAAVQQPVFETLHALADEEPDAAISAADTSLGHLAFSKALGRHETAEVIYHLDDRARFLPVPGSLDDTLDRVTLAALETLNRIGRHDPEALAELEVGNLGGLWGVVRKRSNGRIVFESLAVLVRVATAAPHDGLDALDYSLGRMDPDPGAWVEDESRYAPVVAAAALLLYEVLADADPEGMAAHADAVAAARERAGDVNPTDGDVLDELPVERERLVDVLDSEIGTNALEQIPTGEHARHPSALTDRLELLGVGDTRHAAVEGHEPVIRALVEASRQRRTGEARQQLRTLVAIAASNPRMAGDDLDRVLAAAAQLDDTIVAADALAVTLAIASRDPDAVVPHVKAVSSLADGHDGDVAVAAAGVVAELARYDPTAATDGVGTLLAGIEPLAQDAEELLAGVRSFTDGDPEYAAELLEVVDDIAVEHPEAVVNHLGEVIDAGTMLFPEEPLGPTRSLFAQLSKAEIQAENAFRRALLATLSTIRSVALERPSVADEGLSRLFAEASDFGPGFDRIQNAESGLVAAEYSLLLSELTALTGRPTLAERALAELEPVIEMWTDRFGDEEFNVSVAVAHVEAACVAALERFDDPDVALAAFDRLDELSAAFRERFPAETVVDVFCNHPDREVRRSAVELLSRRLLLSVNGEGRSVKRFAAGIADATDPRVLVPGIRTLGRAASAGSDLAVKEAEAVGAAVAGSDRPLATLEAGLDTVDGDAYEHTAFYVELLSGYLSETKYVPQELVTLAVETLTTVLDERESAATTAAAMDLIGRIGSVPTGGGVNVSP